LLPALLNTNLQGVGEMCCLERSLGSQQSAAVDGPVLLQIMTVRDMTQPLRPCADMLDSEAPWSAVSHQNSAKRLLRLTVTDGIVTIPAVEMQTLAAFERLPLPGEKLLVKGGTVAAGMLVMTDDSVTVMGGTVSKLRKEVLLSLTKGASTGAPVFEPFVTGQSYAKPPAATVPETVRAPTRGAGGGCGGVQHGPAAGVPQRGGRGRGRSRGGAVDCGGGPNGSERGGRGGSCGWPRRGARGGYETPAASSAFAVQTDQHRQQYSLFPMQ
jgi:tudor domain-containing protein 3